MQSFLIVFGGILTVAGGTLLLTAGWKVTVRRVDINLSTDITYISMKTGWLDLYTHRQVKLRNPGDTRIVERFGGFDTRGQYQLLVDTDTGPVPVTTMFGIIRKWEEEAKMRLEAFLADSSIESMTIKEPKTSGMVASVVLIGTGLCMFIIRLLI
jgi:hypothetical protein